MVFSEVGKSTAVVEVKMSEKHQMHCLIDRGRRSVQMSELWVPAMIGVEHVDAHVEDYGFVFESDADARSTHVLSCAQAQNLQFRLL